jgi:DnaK suppressor protein
MYLARKRRQLTELRAQLRGSLLVAQGLEAEFRSDSEGEAHEFEDDAQRLDHLERQGLLVHRGIGRLARVERALEKLDEGSYGLSDLSGAPIRYERLEILPDAIDTEEEHEAGESVR